MNVHAIYHRSDSEFAFAIDSHRIRLRLKVDKNDTFTSVRVIYGVKYLYAEKRRFKEMERTYEDDRFAYYTVTLRLRDVRLAYIFKLTEADGRRYYYSEEGPQPTFNFKTAYYSFFQFPYINKIDVMPEIAWARKAVFYQIFVDRFAVGRDGKDYVNLSWGAKPTPKSFAGGDLPGLTKKLGYLSRLGVNVIYLTPIFRSDSNHKYDISDYESIDPMFGSADDFRALVMKAHSLGMKIILDAVFNHCSEDSRFFQDVLKNRESSPYRDWFIFTSPDEYETFGFCSYMPKWNTSNPEVQRYLCSVGTSWIRDYDIDGWRLDVSDEVSHSFWRAFRRAVKAVKPEAILIGENWHDAHSYLLGDQYDSIMNYSFAKVALDLLAWRTKDAAAASARLSELLMRNTDTVNAMMLNLLDSHDTHRFVRMCQENSDRMLQGVALMIFYPGIPMVYYGDEIPMTGGYDPDCRRCFPWDRVDPKDGYGCRFRALLALRRAPGFAAGAYRTKAESGLLIQERISGRSIYRLTLNTTKKSVPFKPEGRLIGSNLLIGDTLKPDGYAVEVRKEE